MTNLRRTLLLAASHAGVPAAGFAGGIHALPILTALPASAAWPYDAGMDIAIRRIELADAPGFRLCLDAVARERRYLAQVEAPAQEQVDRFVRQSVDDDAAQYVAVDDGRVVGWCDVFGHWAHALQHTGTLGMGVLAAYRGRGLGERLLRATLDDARRKGLWRVSLEARADNERAIRLYEKLGFRHEGIAAAALRFDGVFHDGVRMALWQGPERPG